MSYANLKLVILLLILITLVGCYTTSKLVDPTWTTYPRSKITWGKQSWMMGWNSKSELNLKNANYSKVKQQEYGLTKDGVGKRGTTGVKDVWIKPDNRSEYSKIKLQGKIPAEGNKACKGNYLVEKTQYYYGGEATLKFMGINTPALKTSFRCPIDNKFKLSPSAARLEKLSSNFRDSKYFDISSFRVPVASKTLAKKFLETIKHFKMKILSVEKVSKGIYVIANSRPVDSIYGIQRKIVALVEDEGSNSRLTFRYFLYILREDKNGTSALKTKFSGITPLNRLWSFRHHRWFLTDLNKRLGLRLPKEYSSDVKSTSLKYLVDSERIRSVQSLLNYLGYKPGYADGAMGSKTRKALKLYQRDHSLNQSGTLDQPTLESLDEIFSRYNYRG